MLDLLEILEKHYKDERPSRDEYFLLVANLVSIRSTCKRHRYGAVLTKYKKIISTGYNGAPKGLSHCLGMDSCSRDDQTMKPGTGYEICRSVHAEQNAIVQCNTSKEDSELYVNGIPCTICTRLIINSGIKRVVCINDKRRSDNSVNLLKEAGVVVEVVESDV